MKTINNIEEVLKQVHTVAIAGHRNPDGDCVGSCMGLYLYLKDNYPDIKADVYMEEPLPVFDYIKDLKEAKTICESGKEYDLVVILDVSSVERIGVAADLLESAKNTVCIDHHVTNVGICEVNHVLPDASSTSEVLYHLLDDKKISKECAESLYTGIVHDTGVFQYSCTAPETMRVAANLMEKGVAFTKIIEETFYQKTYAQNQIMGRTVMESIMLLDSKCIVGIVRQKELDFYGIETRDLDGIVNQLRNTKGVDVAIFLYEMSPQTFKVSLRTTENVDASKVAAIFGGGGHARAAGCTMQGQPFDVINSLTLYIEKQLTGVE